MRASWIASLLVLGACGLLGGDPASRPVPSDGVGNFGDSTPIELCIGPAQVVSRASVTGAGAVCVKQGTSGASCNGTGTGAGDASCSGLERCVCGRCIVVACEGAGSCAGERVCRNKRCTTACSADADCGAGERCITGGCARSCASDAACHHGERCDALDSVCASQLCSADVPCGAGDVCEAVQVEGELHEPDLVPAGDVAFVEMRTFGANAGSAIYRARVEAGAVSRWTADPTAPVVSATSGRVGAPSVFSRDGALELYFVEGEGKAILHAVSTDGGRSFTRDAKPVLMPSEPWEKGWVGSPSAVLHNGEVLLFYEGGPRAGIGVARVASGVATRLPGGPVVAPEGASDPLFWRGVTEVGAPFAVVAEGALRLYFTGRGAEGGDALAGDTALPAERNDSIGLFTTRDLVHFDRYPNGPVFARTANLRAYLGEREAVVRLLPGGAEITFVATDASGDNVSGLAQAGP